MKRDLRTLSVPEGVAGERIDSALTRVLGLSRTTIVKLLEDGDIKSNGVAMQKSERVVAGQLIEVLMPAPLNQDPIPLTPLVGLTVIYNDDEIVVIGTDNSGMAKEDVAALEPIKEKDPPSQPTGCVPMQVPGPTVPLPLVLISYC